MAVNPTRLSLGALRRFAGSPLVAKMGLQKPATRLLYNLTRTSVSIAGKAAKASPLKKPARLPQTDQPADDFDLSLSDEQQMLCDSLARFAEAEMRPRAQDADSAAKAPPDWPEKFAELGLNLAMVPEEAGGAGIADSPVTHALMTETLARGDMGLAVAGLAPLSAALALARWADQDQQSVYLKGFAADQPTVAALAVCEPRPLFNPMSLQTRAEVKKGGYQLDGEKSLVPVAAEAEFFLVAAALGEDENGLFLVERDSAGVTIEADPGMGVRAAGLGRLTLNRVSLPGDARLAANAFDYGEFVQRCRIAWCALGVGTAQAMLDYVIPYCNEREAFGEPISHRQAVAFMIADIATELEGMRLLTWRAASRAEQSRSFGREASLARRFCAEHGMQIGSDGVQLLGGHGFVKDHPVERWYRDLRALAVMEGGLLV